MGSPYRSTNPTEWDDIDGIIINEQSPPPSISGVGANTAVLIGQFQRGTDELTDVGSVGELHELYGKSSSFGGNQSLKNKKFASLRVVRVIASDAVKASKAFQSSSTDRITFTAKHKGAYGNSITVTIAAGTTSGKKYTIKDTNSGAVLPDEVYDNVVITAIDSSTFADSKLVDVTVNSSAAEPDNAAATALEDGDDGTVADTDYQSAIAKCEVERAGNVLFLDAYNSTRNGYLKTHVDAQLDKMAICAGAEGDSVSTAASAAASLRSDRIIYAYPWVQTTLDGVSTYQSPASWIASILSQISPHLDPAATQNAKLLSGVTGLKTSLTRSNYVTLDAAGVCALEQDADFGFKPKNGVTTSITDGYETILRRRMADYLQNSVAYFLKQYQNEPNTKANRTQVKGAMLAWIRKLESEGILPSDKDVSSGVAKSVDTESLNTDDLIAQGYFKILYRQRLISSMRYIVLQAEIGQGVVVTEVG